MTLELIFPVNRTLEVLRDGGLEFVGGSAHSVPFAFPGWKGGKLLASLAQNMYWFLILRSDLNAKKGDISAIKGLNIGAAPLVDLGLKRLLVEAGIDIERDKVKIGPVPGAFLGEDKNFGVAAANAAGPHDRRLLGEWHGCGSRGAQRRRHHGHRCAPRRRPAQGDPLHDAGAHHLGCRHCARSRRGRDRYPRQSVGYEDVVATNFSQYWES